MQAFNALYSNPGLLLATLALALLLSVCLYWLIRLAGGGGAGLYTKVECLNSPAEQRFQHALEQAIKSLHLRVYLKVRLADVVSVRAELSGKAFWRAFAPIAAKHLDFVLCHADNRIYCAIELDDRSHQRPDRRDRDALVDEVLHSAGIPLLRVPIQKRYDIAALQDQLQQMDAASLH